MMQCKFKIGDRIFYEIYGTEVEDHHLKVTGIGSAIVRGLRPSSYIDDDGKIVKYFMLKTGPMTVIEDYNCLPYDDPRVQKEMEKWKKHDEQRNEMFMWVSNKWNVPYDEVEKHIQWLLNCNSADEKTF